MQRRPLLLTAAGLALPRLGLAQAPWPNRPVTILVPYVAGGPSDTLARAAGTALGATIGQPVVVENRPGANGAVAVALFRQAADGTQTVLGTEGVVPGLTYVAGQKIAVALEVTGTSPTTVRAKVWAAGGTEPTAWAKTATDSTAGLQAAGRVGFHSYLSASATNAPVVSSWDDLTITKAGN